MPFAVGHIVQASALLILTYLLAFTPIFGDSVFVVGSSNESWYISQKYAFIYIPVVLVLFATIHWVVYTCCAHSICIVFICSSMNGDEAQHRTSLCGVACTKLNMLSAQERKINLNMYINNTVLETDKAKKKAIAISLLFIYTSPSPAIE